MLSESIFYMFFYRNNLKASSRLLENINSIGTVSTILKLKFGSILDFDNF